MNKIKIKETIEQYNVLFFLRLRDIIKILKVWLTEG